MTPRSAKFTISCVQVPTLKTANVAVPKADLPTVFSARWELIGSLEREREKKKYKKNEICF